MSSGAEKMDQKQLQCRIVITHSADNDHSFALGMYDPCSGRHEALGRHPTNQIEKIVGDLRIRMEREGHLVSFSEITGER